MTYQLNGEQYLVLAISGGNYSGELVAFKLPSPQSTMTTSSIAAPVPQRTARSVLDGVYSPAQALRGEPLYKQHCASCHGSALEGNETATALAGADFIDKWNRQTVGDLLERIARTMPLDKPGRLSREVNADITAYLLNRNRFPSGKAELIPDIQALKQIRIEPKRQ